MNDEDLSRQLRDAADDIDTARTPVTASDARGQTAETGPSRTRLIVASAAAVAVLVAGAAFLTARDDTSPTEIGPANTTVRSETTNTAPAATAPTTTAPPTTTRPPTTEPAREFPEIALTDLPVWGLAVDQRNGSTTVYHQDGTRITDTATATGTNSGRALVFSTRQSRLELPIHVGALEIPPGCTSAVTTPTDRVAICADDQEIRRFGADGASTLIARAPTANPEWTGELLGHWQRVVPSPAGTLIFAQWSGECESPTTFRLGNVDNPRAISEPENGNWWEAPESTALGWSDDEQLLVEFGHGLCGTGVEQPGVYALSVVDKRGPELLIAYDEDPGQSTSIWRKSCNCGNEVEAAVIPAIEAAGLTPCCGEDSHGGSGARAGVLVEGTEVGIWADPTDRALDLIGPGSIAFIGLVPDGEQPDPRLVLFYPDNANGLATPIVLFTCGDYTFRISHFGAEQQTDSLVRLRVANDLLPHLGCTLRDPVVLDAEPSAIVNSNELEQWVFSAIGDRFEYGCCGEPSEGGTGVADGVVYEGWIIPIFGDLTTEFLADVPDELTTERLSFLDGEATIVRSDQGVVVLFTCGDYTLTTGWYEDTAPEIDKMVMLCEDLVSRMPCGLREPAIG